MDAARKGADALAASQPEKAVEFYTAAIIQMPEAVDYYIQRSTAYRRSRKNELALADANSAVGFAQKRARKELIAKAQLERAIVLYGLERYGDAQQVFAWSEELNAADKRIGIWKVKIEEKLKALGPDDEKTKVTVDKIPQVDLEKIKGDAAAAAPKPKAAPAATKVEEKPAAPAFTPADKIRHDWYQSTETVTVTLLAKNVPKDKAQIYIQPRSLSISFPLPTGSDYDFSLEPLFGQIDVAASSYRVLSTKVEFVLKKATSGTKWSKLEADSLETSGADGDLADQAAKVTVKDSAPAYPTSSRSGPKNWDKVVNDIRQADRPEGEKGPVHDDDDDAEGDEVNGFFKKIYKNADPDTRRAMMKSYTESNGTALSTNWGEVGKKNYETTPPDGMEAKKWGE